jgi:hypothetical protein
VRTAGAAVALVLSTAPIAAAADYPFSGFFAANADRVSFEQAQLLCAYNFFIQEKDGTFINYHLDLAGYTGHQSVRYLEYSRGHCFADTDQRIETCITTADSDPSQPGNVFVDVYRLVSPEVIAVRFFDNANQAGAFVREGTVGDSTESEYDQCAGFDRTSMADYLSAEKSTLSLDEREKFIVPKLDAATTAIMESVLEAIRAGKKE